MQLLVFGMFFNYVLIIYNSYDLLIDTFVFFRKKICSEIDAFRQIYDNVMVVILENF